jgi:protein-disulfide isomerase
MKRILASMLAVSAFAVISTFTASGDDLESLSGKWLLKKKSPEGQAITQSIEIKKDKFTFEIKNSDSKTVLYAEGSIKLEKLGAFKSVKFFNIKAGESASQTESVDEERQSIYQLGDGTLTVASNFDAVRDDKPNVDVYTKAGN